MTIPLGAASAAEIFHHKSDEIKELPNVLGKADDIFIVGYDADGKDHGRMLKQVVQIC